ncbi:MAG: hypothetical protein HY461_00040 [Parcubacteria group bacterium]|nr:hypothetical protein [Parcubacteria group bacterium]
MLDHLFGSKTRVGLLRLFFDNPDQAYFVRELTRVLDAQINSIRRELENLAALGIVQVIENIEEASVEPVDETVPKGLNKKKYYRLNTSFVLYTELSGLFSKSHLLLEKELLSELRQIGQVHYLVLTGFFTGLTDTMTDMLIVGTVNKPYFADLIRKYEKKLGREINFTVMPLKEFQYRREITDRFLYDILVHPKIVVVDLLGVNQ